MKPIETHYAGCRFRSRLEARWAVFFDTLGIQWEYEFQGYDLPSGWYLPDFWLPHVQSRHPGGDGIDFEVKPYKGEDDPRWSELTEATGRGLYVAFGLPRPPHDSGNEWIEEWGGDCWDNCMTFCDCWDGWSMQYGPEGNYHRDVDHPRIDRALEAARSARFEHGETGRHIHLEPDDVIIRTRHTTKSTALGSTTTWLQEYMTSQGHLARIRDVEDAGRAAGHSARVIRRAARTMGLIIVRDGLAPAYWRTPWGAV